MKILAIADRYDENLSYLLKNEKDIDLIITLGDLEYFDIKELENINIPKIGIHGNHCTRGYMQQLEIEDLHLKSKKFNDLIFGGFEGCVRYKNFGDFQYTQDEANEMIVNLPKVDILITHCPPLGINNNNDPAHIGFKVLKDYIDEYNPKAIFHGHTYNLGNFVEEYNNTKVFYIFGAKIIEI